MSEAPNVLLAAGDVERRRVVAAGPLAPLARSLAADLAPLVARVLSVPPAELLPVDKARMTRIGGRCDADGSLLAFDPFAPRRHRCSTCGREYDRDEDYRWWIMWYQLWLAERAVHGATLALVAGDATGRVVASAILVGCAARYLAYPNRDNVLGPTRPFFSTYLESIWLLQLCVALDLLEALPDANRALGGVVRERVIEPSRALIASYDEGASNRQVWNAAALAAAARVLNDPAGVERALLGPSGVVAHLGEGLLADGTWYEGENYHQFAHRGLWYGVTIAERAGVALPADLVRRFDAGFAAPFLTAMPDLTFPARRDSQWAVSLRQWRYAESCELGLARDAGAPLLASALASLYDDTAPVPRRATGRAHSAAESERNEPATRLTRADLGWRSLLFARPALPNASRWSPRSAHLPSQGLAVFRRDAGSLWTALDYGESGGSHGHPDRLNLLLVDGTRRWLDDMGTGSYVDRSLHWYRSTLAHNAPLVGGRSQPRTSGRLVAYDERGDWGWIRAAAAIAPGVLAHRTLVVAGDYVVDRLEWHADHAASIDLPLHVDATIVGATAWQAADAGGGTSLEDGFDFLSSMELTSVPAGAVVTLAAGDDACAWVVSTSLATWFRAVAPGAPGQGHARFLFVRVSARDGALTTVWNPRGAVDHVATEAAAVVVSRRDARVDRHTPVAGGWRIIEQGEGETREIVLRGIAMASDVDDASARVRHHDFPPAMPLSRDGTTRVFALGAAHYRRSEETWREAGQPRATVRVAVSGDSLEVDVAVIAPFLQFMPPGTDNPLDNERAEINGHGVQLHVQPGPVDDPRSPARAWLLVPDADDASVRVIPTSPHASLMTLDAVWSRTADGFVLRCRIPLGAVLLPPPDEPVFGLDVIVNETAPGRERRRGQLVLSGARDEFVYLRGDRQDAARFIRLRLVP